MDFFEQEFKDTEDIIRYFFKFKYIFAHARHLLLEVPCLSTDCDGPS